MDNLIQILYIDRILEPYFGGVDIVSVTFKLFLATFLSGFIGLERGSRKHPAGFRTHILVCVGACIAMMTNQYIIDFVSATADPARLGAQVITGVGFLGAGTIMLAGRHVVGLTTAAGLWASACLGLAIGVGFFSAAFIATVFIIIVLSFLPNIEGKIYSNSRLLSLHIEINDAMKFMDFTKYIGDHNIQVLNTTVSKSSPLISGGISFRMNLKRPRNMSRSDIVEYMQGFDGVYLIEEL